jgi:hypothetical protein
MKVTFIELHIEEQDLDLYEKSLGQLGWTEVQKKVYQKQFGTALAEIREHVPIFSGDITLSVHVKNPEGMRLEDIQNIMNELRKADQTPD